MPRQIDRRQKPAWQKTRRKNPSFPKKGPSRGSTKTPIKKK